MRPTSIENLVKIDKNKRSYVAFISEILVKCLVLGPKPHLCTDRGEIWREEVDVCSTPPCQISPRSVQSVALAGRKTSKSPLSNLNTSAITARNAAGKKTNKQTNNIELIRPPAACEIHGNREAPYLSCNSKTCSPPTHSFAARGR